MIQKLLIAGVILIGVVLGCNCTAVVVGYVIYCSNIECSFVLIPKILLATITGAIAGLVIGIITAISGRNKPLKTDKETYIQPQFNDLRESAVVALVIGLIGGIFIGLNTIT